MMPAAPERPSRAESTQRAESCWAVAYPHVLDATLGEARAVQQLHNFNIPTVGDIWAELEEFGTNAGIRRSLWASCGQVWISQGRPQGSFRTLRVILCSAPQSARRAAVITRVDANMCTDSYLYGASPRSRTRSASRTARGTSPRSASRPRRPLMRPSLARPLRRRSRSRRCRRSSGSAGGSPTAACTCWQHYPLHLLHACCTSTAHLHHTCWKPAPCLLHACCAPVLLVVLCLYCAGTATVLVLVQVLYWFCSGTGTCTGTRAGACAASSILAGTVFFCHSTWYRTGYLTGTELALYSCSTGCLLLLYGCCAGAGRTVVVRVLSG